MKLNRVMAIVEGRDLNARMTNDLIDASKRAGFEPVHIKTVDSNDIVENALEKYFPDLVVWRSPVNYKSTYEVERMVLWVNDHCKVKLNTDVMGGRNCTSSKYYQHGLFLRDPILKEHVLPMYLAHTRDYVRSLIKEGKLSYPFVLKPDLGTRGEGIVLIKNDEELSAFRPDGRNFSVEPYMESECDWRVFTIGGIALGAMRKVGDMADERNFEAKSGGRDRWNETDPAVLEEIMDLAVRAAAVSGLEYAGIDIIRESKTGKFYVLETNISAGWQNGYQRTTGVSVADEIMNWFNDRIEYFEKPIYTAVSDYVGNRLKYLPKIAQTIYIDIINYHFKVDRDREKCVADLDDKEVNLTEKLLSGYCLVTQYEPTDDEKIRLRDLVNTISKYEISRYGNFVGKDSGVLADSISDTALYLAISAKL